MACLTRLKAQTLLNWLPWSNSQYTDVKQLLADKVIGIAMSEKRTSAELKKQLIELTRLRDELEGFGIIKGTVIEAMETASVAIEECMRTLKAHEQDQRKARKAK